MSATTPVSDSTPATALWRFDRSHHPSDPVDRLCCENAVDLPVPVDPLRPIPGGPRPAPGEGVLDAEVMPHLPMLRQVAQRILRCPEQAEDAVQDAIVVLWKRNERPPELRGWLVKTVIHRSLHRRRTEARRQRWEDAAAVSAAVTCPLCDPEEEFAQRELLEVVEAAVASLAEEHRVVIALRSQGLEYDEIARRLDLPIGTVRSRLNRARRALRERVGPEAG
ncbi:MAG: RNA polymerase sigma factor [Myxococcota bacterium]